MGLRALNPDKYGALCAEALPKVIESVREFDRMMAKLEELTFKAHPTREEAELAKLLEALIAAYDDEHSPIPDTDPHEMLRFLMEQRGLRQAELVPVLGSRSQVSDAVNGKRGISKEQAKKLAAFFRVSADLFL